MSDHAPGGNAVGPIFAAQFTGLHRRRLPVILDMVKRNCRSIHGRVAGVRRKRFHDVSYWRIVVIDRQPNAAGIDDGLAGGQLDHALDVRTKNPRGQSAPTKF
jgi:hypothetical protein